jgi:hypothetical protein
MTQTPDTGDEVLFPAGELINASELREFVYCESSWWLSRQGYVVSVKAQEQRAAGVAFHTQRAGAARRGSSNQGLWFAILLILAAIAVWLVTSFAGMRP